jgi:hypothetical protein
MSEQQKDPYFYVSHEACELIKNSSKKGNVWLHKFDDIEGISLDTVNAMQSISDHLQDQEGVEELQSTSLGLLKEAKRKGFEDRYRQRFPSTTDMSTTDQPALANDMNIFTAMTMNKKRGGRPIHVSADPKLKEFAEQKGFETHDLLDVCKQCGFSWWQRRKIRQEMEKTFPAPPKPSRWQRFKNWISGKKSPDPEMVRERGQQLDEQRIFMQREIEQKSRGLKVDKEVTKKDMQLHEEILKEIPKKSKKHELEL